MSFYLHRVFPQCVTSVLFLGNMLRARKYLFALCTRKYQFALCFRVLSNLYVEKSAYANVFKFNREKKHFERAQVNSRCFHWFPASMFILNTIIFSDILCLNNSSSEYRTSPELLHVVYLLLFYDI